MVQGQLRGEHSTDHRGARWCPREPGLCPDSAGEPAKALGRGMTRSQSHLVSIYSPERTCTETCRSSATSPDSHGAVRAGGRPSPIMNPWVWAEAADPEGSLACRGQLGSESQHPPSSPPELLPLQRCPSAGVEGAA